MKKFGLLALALVISVSMMSAPTLANKNITSPAQQAAQPPPLSEAATAAYGDYYNERDEAKKYEKAKAFLEKFSTENEYWLKSPKSFIQRYELKQVYNKCQDADKTFFTTPNEANLNGFLNTCDAWLAKAPKPDVYYTTRMSLGTGYGVLAGFYKDTDRGTGYTGKALDLLGSSTAPEGWKQPDWDAFRKDNIGRLTQYQGLYKLRQGAPDNSAAADLLSKAAAIKDGPAYSDPNTYLLRAEAVTAEYTKLNTEYNVLSDEEKRGEKGKAILEKIYPVVSRLANDYARVVAMTDGKQPLAGINTEAKSQTEAFYKFLKNGKTEGIDELYKHYKADVGAADLPIKPEESTTPRTTPVSGKGAKAAAGGSAGSASSAAPGGSGKTDTTTKPATTTKTTPKKRG